MGLILESWISARTSLVPGDYARRLSPAIAGFRKAADRASLGEKRSNPIHALINRGRWIVHLLLRYFEISVETRARNWRISTIPTSRSQARRTIRKRIRIVFRFQYLLSLIIQKILNIIKYINRYWLKSWVFIMVR